MTFEEKKALAIAIMDSKKLWKSNYTPPLLRGLWKLGLKIPPFPFIPSGKILSASAYYSGWQRFTGGENAPTNCLTGKN